MPFLQKFQRDGGKTWEGVDSYHKRRPQAPVLLLQVKKIQLKLQVDISSYLKDNYILIVDKNFKSFDIKDIDFAVCGEIQYPWFYKNFEK